jgi:hypothetical protein
MQYAHLAMHTPKNENTTIYRIKWPCYFQIEAFNENGIGPKTPVIEVR